MSELLINKDAKPGQRWICHKPNMRASYMIEILKSNIFGIPCRHTCRIVQIFSVQGVKDTLGVPLSLDQEYTWEFTMVEQWTYLEGQDKPQDSQPTLQEALSILLKYSEMLEITKPEKKTI